VAAAAPLGVIGGTIPIGIGIGDGVGFPMVFVVCTVILLLFSAGFTALTPFVPNAGAFYSYIAKGLGRRVGFGSAFVALFAYLAETIAVYGLMASGAANLFDSWGLHVHWIVWALVGMGVVTYLGHRNIDLSKRVLGVLLIAEVIIVVILDTVVFSTGGASGVSTDWLKPSVVMSGAPGLALLFAFLSFLGFEATAVFRDEAKDPDRTIPIATYVAVVMIGVFYVVSTWALITAWGNTVAVQVANNNPTGMLPDATHRYLGALAYHVVLVLFVTSLFACVLSFHNIVARYGFTLANRCALPAQLGTSHARHGSPAVASATITVISLVFVIGAAAFDLDPATQLYSWFAGTTTVAFILLLLGTSLAAVIFFSKMYRGGHRPYSVWRMLAAPGLAALSLIGVFILVLDNLPGLVGDSTPIAVAILALLVLTFACGAIAAWRRPSMSLENG
jgi:amino acid transporter